MNVIDLYEMVAAERGIRPEELSVEERRVLVSAALPVMYAGFQMLPDSDRYEDPIALVPYDPTWPSRFEEWKQRLLAALPQPPHRIDHVGSTAVPGLAAKPVVDIQISVGDPNDEASYVPAIESLGVQLRNRDEDHRFFRPFAALPRDVHVHVCQAGSEWERRHLLFRDYLRAHPAARQAYLQAKEEAAARWADDRVAYTEAKGMVIGQLTAEAERWSVTKA